MNKQKNRDSMNRGTILQKTKGKLERQAAT